MATPPNQWLTELAAKIETSHAISMQRVGTKSWWKHSLNIPDRLILASALRFAAKSQCWTALDDYGQMKICIAQPGHEGEHHWQRP